MSLPRPELPRFPRAPTNPANDTASVAPTHTEPPIPNEADGTMSSHVDPTLAASIDERIHMEVQHRLREFTMSPSPAPNCRPHHNIDIPRHLSSWPADALLSGVDTFRVWNRTLQDHVGTTIYAYITTGHLPARADDIDRENVEIFAVRQVSDGVAVIHPVGVYT